jgi:polysaccharide biosynthesis/export protein
MRSRIRGLARVAVASAAAVLLGVRAAPAQARSADAPEALTLQATRETLEARARQLEDSARALHDRGAARDVLSRAAAIRSRLAEGDFAVGDRVFLTVEGEKELSDTFAVGPGHVLTLPVVGDVSLAGVLRSELQGYLTRRLKRNLRDPVVRAIAFVRLSVQGAVAHPGYYEIPASAALPDALMAAGGTTQKAKVHDIRIERDGKVLTEGRALQQLIAEGRTIDEAGLLAGDELIVPTQGASAGEVLRFGAFLLGIPVTIFSLTRLF